MKRKLTANTKLSFKFLLVSEKNQRDALIRTLTDQQLQILVEIIYNLIKGGISISNKYKEMLTVNKGNIREVVEESISKRIMRKRLLKISGDLPIILQAFFKYESGTGASAKEKI